MIPIFTEPWQVKALKEMIENGPPLTQPTTVTQDGRAPLPRFDLPYENEFRPLRNVTPDAPAKALPLPPLRLTDKEKTT